MMDSEYAGAVPGEVVGINYGDATGSMLYS